MRLILFFTLIIFAAACKKTDTSPKVEPISQDKLQGYWEQKDPYKDNDFAGYFYQFKIFGDSFQMIQGQWTDIVTPECRFTHWRNYMTGKISIKNDSLLFKGIYTDFIYQKLESSVCQERIKIGEYSSGFKAHFINDSLEISSNDPTLIYRGAILFKK